MALRLNLSKDEHSQLPEPLKAAYRAEGDGFALDVDGLEPPRTEDVTGLKNTVANLRKQLKEQNERAKQYEGLDVEQYRALLAKESEREEAEAKKKGDWESRAKALAEKHAKDLEAERKRTADAVAAAEAAKKSAQDRWIQQEAMAALSATKANADLLMPHVASRLRVVTDENGKELIAVVDESGQTVPGKVGLYQTPMELLQEWRERPQYAAAFEGTRASGGGTQSGPRVGGNGSVIRLSVEESKNPQIYREAKERAAKEGKQLFIPNPGQPI